MEGLNVARRFGMMTEEDFGFSPTYAFQWPSGYEKYLRAMHNRVKQIYQMDNTTLEAIQNIIKNCIEHMDDGGELSVTMVDTNIFTSKTSPSEAA